MAYKPDYGKDLFKQVQDLLSKCDNLSLEMKKDRKEHKKEKEVLNNKITELENRVDELETENTKLRNDNERLKKQINNDSNNSSNPPSSDIKRNIPNNKEKTNKKAGGQKGHKAHFLSKKEIEEKIEKKEIKHKIINKGKVSKDYISKYIIDIEINTIAKEYRFYKDKNGKYNIPKEFKTDVQYGNKLKTMCTILNTEGIVALDRLSDFVGSISDGKINISKGTIVNFITDLNNKGQYIIENIKTKIMNSEIMYTDATTARCENKNISVRNYSTEKYTLLVATYGKSKKYIEETNILNNYTGNLVHDHETVIYNYGNKHAECNVHISRYLRGCNENTGNKWTLKMRSFLCSLNEYKKEIKSRGEKEIAKEKLEKYSKRYEEIIELGYKENKKVKAAFLRQDEQRLLNRMKKYKENHLLFLYDFNMPFENNLSERDLRHVKSKQKISGHFNSMEGIGNYLNIKSIIGTCKKQGESFYDKIFNIYENIPVSI